MKPRPAESRFLNKNWGQHLLNDTRILQRMADTIAKASHGPLVEIGPGTGALTRYLIRLNRPLTLIEKDGRFVESLAAWLATLSPSSPVRLLHADILKWAPNDPAEKFTLVGNIPYNISSELMEWIIQRRRHIAKIFMTVQWEFARRLSASPGSKSYGRLSCLCATLMPVRIHFKIPRQAFSPPPRVLSCFWEGTPSPHSGLPRNEPLWRELLDRAFAHRRKKIINVLKEWQPRLSGEEICDRSGIQPDLRPDQLGKEDYVRLADTLDQLLAF